MKTKPKNKKNILSTRGGFTLVEIILYMALLGIFLITLTDIFKSIIDIQLENQSTSSVEQDGRYILARLAYDINRASSITTPSAAGESGSTLSFSKGSSVYFYFISANNLRLQTFFPLTSANLNSSETKVSNLSFQRIGNAGGKDTLRIQFTLESTTERTAGSETRNFTTTIGIR